MPTNQLSAIMFTDIVGYTSMMQQDRERAMRAVKLHESTLKAKISQYEGELLQTYGDGSLSIFNSASAAIQCAKEIQEMIRDQVPLRIGLHIGEITRDGEHTFGDGVNIASRIESMGQAGTVLFSKDLYSRIRNRPEF
ncbi:MAG: adenylate/guanylate cyclase domain-containing protein, partial [Bacteroidetes bacterium]|nr:adenylate/guanylate cyclase domain-containing protein [Bacteroidota bacterium]